MYLRHGMNSGQVIIIIIIIIITSSSRPTYQLEYEDGSVSDVEERVIDGNTVGLQLRRTGLFNVDTNPARRVVRILDLHLTLCRSKQVSRDIWQTAASPRLVTARGGECTRPLPALDKRRVCNVLVLRYVTKGRNVSASKV